MNIDEQFRYFKKEIEQLHADVKLSAEAYGPIKRQLGAFDTKLRELRNINELNDNMISLRDDIDILDERMRKLKKTLAVFNLDEDD